MMAIGTLQMLQLEANNNQFNDFCVSDEQLEDFWTFLWDRLSQIKPVQRVTSFYGTPARVRRAAKLNNPAAFMWTRAFSRTAPRVQPRQWKRYNKSVLVGFFPRDQSQRNATQRNATQRNATQRNATQRNATRRDATRRNATQRNATQRNATQRNATQRNATQRNATREKTRQLKGDLILLHLLG